MSDTKLLLFRLPKSLFVQFLSEWLDIHDVGKLDSAMTNKKHRSEFLQCLKEMTNQTVPVSFDGTLEHDTNLLSWVSLRQIHVEKLSLCADSIEDLHLSSLQNLVVGTQRSKCPVAGSPFLSECPPWLRNVPQLSPSLEELSVGKVSSRAIMADLIFVLSHCLELKSVSIASLWFQARDCTDDVLAKLQEFGHLIVEIRSAYGYMKHVTTEGFQNFIKCCPRLKKLGYSHFDDNGELLKCVAQSCPLLEDIKFDRCSKPVLLELSRNCKQLRKVKFWRFDEDWVELPASAIKVLKQIDRLEELSLTGCGLTNEKVGVISGLRNLKHLELRELLGVEGLTGAGFRVLEGSPISGTLQSISVKFEEGGDYSLPVQDFDTAEMIAGIASCHNLRKVDLSYHCDDAGLGVLGAGCPLLEEIQLTYGPVTVDGLVALAEHCQHLTKVVLDYDHNEGRDFEAQEVYPVYFDGSSPGYARAITDLPIIRSRLPHIRFECFEDFDLFD